MLGKQATPNLAPQPHWAQKAAYSELWQGFQLQTEEGWQGATEGSDPDVESPLKSTALPKSQPEASGTVLGNTQGQFSGPYVCLWQPAASLQQSPRLQLVTFYPSSDEPSQASLSQDPPGAFPGIPAISGGCFTSLLESTVYLDLGHIRGRMAKNAPCPCRVNETLS